jgi:hypothetical protein
VEVNEKPSQVSKTVCAWRERVNSELSHESSKKHKLTKKQKRENRTLAKERVDNV